MFLGIEHLRDNLFITSLINAEAKVLQISPYTYEGLIHFIDHRDIKVITFNYDFDAKFILGHPSKVIKSLTFKLKEYFDCQIVYSDIDEFLKKIIRKDIYPEDTQEGIEQRLYNLPKIGIKLNRFYISKDRKVAPKQINAVMLSFVSYSYGIGNYEYIDSENNLYVIPKYRYIPRAKRENSEQTTY